MPIKPLFVMTAMLAFAGGSVAQEQARVLSSTPVLVPGSVPAQTAYNVVYEYAGQQYSVQFPYDPGAFVSLQITPIAPAPVVQAPQPVYVQPMPPVTVVNPVLVSPYPGPYYYGPPPFTFNFGFGYYRHSRR